MRLKNRIGKTWKERIANIIIKIRTFDVSINREGYNYIYELIARAMCADEGMLESQMIKNFQAYCEMVKGNYYSAKAYITDVLKIPVYQGMSAVGIDNENEESGIGRKIEYVTIDPNYRRATEDEVRRIENKYKVKMKATKKQLKLVTPDKDFKQLTQSMLKSLEYNRQATKH